MCVQCYFNYAFHHLILNNHILVPMIISILLTFTCLDGTVIAFLLKLSQLLHYIICRAIFFVLCDLAINLDVFWSNEWALKGLFMSGNPFLQNCINKLICCLDDLSFGCWRQLLPSPCCCQLAASRPHAEHTLLFKQSTEEAPTLLAPSQHDLLTSMPVTP